MKAQSINEIKALFQAGKLKEADILTLKNDQRKGVQQIVSSYEKQLLKEKALEQLFQEMSTYERVSYEKGKYLVAGVDEAGRGPLAGPVVAAAVILPRDFKLLGLNDSKQLSEQKREEYFAVIKEEAISYGIAIIDNQTIDNLNILEATKMAMHKAIGQLQPPAEHILIDAVQLENLHCSSESIIKGDANSISIAAASILAKVTRDRIMKEIDKQYPMYDFRSNMGYGTKAHLEGLQMYGISPYHRQSFAPVRDCQKG
ncbi:ribonuclease HII [Ornithinibacillus bavariensis]|uniref:ribonuclease HII n=1 Tax=Ornithinibacillus bavariensis TaxID=545502 RepID=UPI000EC1B894|nr:ribonuclease HII [Ornithinibacillus sp.]